MTFGCGVSGVDRRTLMALGVGGLAALAVGPAHSARYVPGRSLKPGEYVWEPDRSPSGPVVVITSLPEQRVHVYRNGIEIGQSTCSTGRPGHRTPTGVFTILEKQREHVSSIYKGAQMPNMERLTWGGIALHAGNLPGYPASHGCIRLPRAFSAQLYGVTTLGTVVIIADERTQPFKVVHPGALLSGVAVAEADAVASHVAKKKPHGSWDAEVHYPVASVVISRADRKVYVTRDGRLDGVYPVRFVDPGKRIGTHVYSLVGPAADGSGLTWLSFGIGRKPTDAHVVHWGGEAAMKRVVFSDQARALEIARSFHPGTTLLLTDAGAPNSSRRTPRDFAIMKSEQAS